MKYHFRVHKDQDGLWAECVELDGCATQGSTMGELQENAREALHLYLEEPEDSQLVFPLPQDLRGESVIEVQVDPKAALSVLLRNYRLQNHITQRELAERLGMKNLYSYQRLEKSSNPSLEMLARLKEVFPDLSLDYVLSR